MHTPRPDLPIDPLLRVQRLNEQRGRVATPPRPTIGAAPRRTRPARGAKAASLALSTLTTLGLTAAFARADGGNDGIGGGAPVIGNTAVVATPATAATVPTAASTAPTDSAPTTQATTATPATTAAAPAAVTGSIADGTYLGAASSNRWGTVQVQAVYSGGSLVDVQILRYPDADRKSIAINQRALPTLIDEAISAQSADVNGVSGATYTYRSYVTSLQSAIDAAKSASGIA